MAAGSIARSLTGAVAAPVPRRMRRLGLDVAAPAAVLFAVVAVCSAWPAIQSLPSPIGGSVLEAELPVFSPGHLLGTDLNGNDVWSRLLHGGRASLLIALVVNVLGVVIGGTLGAFGVYAGQVADAIIMRSLDVLIAFPALVLVLAVSQALGPSEVNTVWALLFVSVPVFARVARSATLRLRQQSFMLAAHLCGTRAWRTLFRHVAPNILPQLSAFALLGMGIVMVIEGALSFLGLGVPAPAPSWGNMIAHGQHALLTHPTLVLLPSAFLFTTVLSFNLLGEALRDRWNLA